MIINKDNYSQIILDYNLALKKLEDFGIKLPETSRLIEYQNVLKTISTGYIPFDLNTQKKYGFIFMEIDEITKIIGSIEKEISSELFQKLNQLKKDHIIQQQNQTNIEARNTQFELYLKYLIEKPGMYCTLGNPDLIVHMKKGIFDIEAKRPNQNGLDSNLRKGLKQLKESNPGIIAFSLDHLIFNDNDIILLKENESPEDGMDILGKMVNYWAYSNRPKILNRIKSKKSICGLLLHAKVPIIKTGQLNFITIGSFKKMIPLPYSENSDAEEKFKFFYTKFNSH